MRDEDKDFAEEKLRHLCGAVYRIIIRVDDIDLDGLWP